MLFFFFFPSFFPPFSVSLLFNFLNSFPAWKISHRKKKEKCTASRLLACFLRSINGFLQEKFRFRTLLVCVVLNHHFGMLPSSIPLLLLKNIRGASNVCLNQHFVRLLFFNFNKFYLLTNIYITCSGVCAFNWCSLSYSTCYMPLGRQRVGIALSNFHLFD